jgi:peroxiredoxin Q/BCP
MLKAGDRAPDFTLPDDGGAPQSLQALLRRGPLLLYFYPGDFTPLCTREALMIGELRESLERAGFALAGVSPDAPPVHRKFKERYGLAHPLLSDVDKKVIRAFGVDGPLGVGVRRATFWIDRQGRIEAAVRADVRLARHKRLFERLLLAAGRPPDNPEAG